VLQAGFDGDASGEDERAADTDGLFDGELPERGSSTRILRWSAA